MGMVGHFSLSLLIALKATALAETRAEAKDFGTHGIIFPIEEEDPIALIRKKLKGMEETGEIALYERKLQQHAKSAVERPRPVAGITKATKLRVFSYDPTYTISQDLKDHKGRVFAKKGEKINPLETVTLSHTLLFFDGDDEEQVEWAKTHLHEPNAKLKFILVKGAPLSLSEELNAPVYFDQGGALSEKLRIEHVPALLRQEGLRLHIEEIFLGELKNEKT